MKRKHWTEQGTKEFLFAIAADFVTQLEVKLEAKKWNKARLAKALGVSKGRVSQILNNPGNLSLDMIIRSTRALGMKVAVVAYDDNDPKNERGPVNSDVFRICWEKQGKPIDFWSLQESVPSSEVKCTIQFASSGQLNPFYAATQLPPVSGQVIWLGFKPLGENIANPLTAINKSLSRLITSGNFPVLEIH